MGKKTFKRRTMYLGFRKGQGKFAEFMFAPPPIQEEVKTDMASLSDKEDESAENTFYRLPQNLKDMFGTVHVKFFAT